MTVTYSLNVAKARLCGFAKLLVRWRGSIYKLLYREMIIFCSLYFTLSSIYRYTLTSDQRETFENLARYCDAFTNLIPLSFVLGFYVSIVVGRWWQQYMAIPWPDKCSMCIGAYVHGNDDRGRIIRRTLARYLSLLSVLTFQAISTAVKKRFPTLEHVEEAGLMTKEERMVYDEIPVTHGKWWVPAQWFSALAVRARKEGRIKDEILLRALLDEMHVFRGNCGMLFSYDWISIPLVYTQVVTLAIYTYFLATVMGRQYLDPSKNYAGHEVDLYVPIFTILQFFFYMGWLKVAEQLINPFGEDDDDFELNWCLDRNLQVSFQIVDEMHQRHPKLVKDAYWDEAQPQLPYTKSSVCLRTQPHLGSAINLDVDLDESEFVPLETILEEDNEGNKYNSPPTSPTNELLAPNFPSRVNSKHNINDNADSASQTGIRLLADFRGSKILNMLIGSSENVSTPTKKDSGIFPPLFLRNSSRCSRTCSMAASLQSVQVEDPADASKETCSITRKGDFGTNDERRSLIVDFHPPALAANETQADDVSVTVNGPMPTVEETGVCDSVSEVQSQVELSCMESPYEPNSSQESLSPFVDSNQSTVNSFAALLQHPK